VFVLLFSSSRRHTRFSRDWSSDVCSSDLYAVFSVHQTLNLDLRIPFVYHPGFCGKPSYCVVNRICMGSQLCFFSATRLTTTRSRRLTGSPSAPRAKSIAVLSRYRG